ncbi:hypothetical protein L2E82_41047 [Cichorium intybus]|uniref:Uncharacterized protein n=1 Tax=Cichorium intybus TaxID=13427 RepID=A0ACB9AN47_CICIN|nr:hypothetical protein L2E82_41047 [Cichorium intybus]
MEVWCFDVSDSTREENIYREQGHLERPAIYWRQSLVLYRLLTIVSSKGENFEDSSAYTEVMNVLEVGRVCDEKGGLESLEESGEWRWQ